MTREEKLAKRIERSVNRREKNKRRYREWIWRKESTKQRRCNSCGGWEQWCSICQCYTQTCCVDYGTCMCS